MLIATGSVSFIILNVKFLISLMLEMQISFLGARWSGMNFLKTEISQHFVSLLSAFSLIIIPNTTISTSVPSFIIPFSLLIFTWIGWLQVSAVVGQLNLSLKKVIWRYALYNIYCSKSFYPSSKD